MKKDKKKFYGAIQEASELLKFLSHPLRLKLLCLLHHAPMTVSELMEGTDGSQTQISQFLGLMKAKGLVSSEREGAFVRYKLVDEKVKQIIKALENVFC